MDVAILVFLLWAKYAKFVENTFFKYSQNILIFLNNLGNIKQEKYYEKKILLYLQLCKVKQFVYVRMSVRLYESNRF